MTKALIIVDVQYDFIEGGSLAVSGGTELAKAISRDILANSEGKLTSGDYDLIVTTQDWHIDPGAHFSDSPNFKTSWPRHCVAETPGAEIHESIREALGALKDLPQEQIRKGQYEDAYSGFMGTNGHGDSLDTVLNEHGVTEVDIVGIAAEHCVAATALSALEYGYRTRVLLDYSVGIDEETVGKKVLEELPAAGVKVEKSTKKSSES